MHYKRWRRKNPDSVWDWRRPIEERFWRLVEKGPGCWMWKGSLNNGYGSLSAGSRTDHSRGKIPAHVISYELHIGRVPEGAEIDHACRNRACVNPEHLEAVPRRVNILRGESIVAKNARKTHCPKGHPYDDQNTVRSKDGSRSCRACRRERQRQWNLKSHDQSSGITGGNSV